MDGPRIYNFFPTLVGPIARWGEHVPRIAAMGFDTLYVNPFTPPGHSGSLYAVRDYRALNPALRGEATEPDDALLRGFTEAARAHGLRVLVDLVINHSAEDSPLVAEHPEWYARDEDGAIAHPFVVDSDDPETKTVWGDLAEFDYAERPEREALVAYVRDVALFYASLGFGGFRCDAAYKIPGDVWQTIITAVRAEHPDSVFVAETLGGPEEEVEQLGPAGFDFFFNSAKWWDFRAPWFVQQYETFRAYAPSIAFPESHDTPRLAAELAEGDDVEREYRFRYLFAAAIASGVMMPIGYEYGFATALDVVGATPEAWETPRFDLSAWIASVNAVKAATPVLRAEGALEQVAGADGGIVVMLRGDDPAERALIVVNPDSAEEATFGAESLAAAGLSGVRPLFAEHATPEADGDALRVGPRSVAVFLASFTPPAPAELAAAGASAHAE